jgi:hypothetical protein
LISYVFIIYRLSIMVKKGEKLSAEHLEKMRAGRAKKSSERQAVKEAAKKEKKMAAKKSTSVVAAPKADDKDVEIPTKVPGAATKPFVKEVKAPKVRGVKKLENPEAAPEEKPKGKKVGRSGKSAGLEYASDLVNTNIGNGALVQIAGQKAEIAKDLSEKPPAGVMSEVSGVQGNADKTTENLPVHDPKALDGGRKQFSFIALRRTLMC